MSVERLALTATDQAYCEGLQKATKIFMWGIFKTKWEQKQPKQQHNYLYNKALLSSIPTPVRN